MNFSGSPIFWILAALALAAIVVFFERLLELRRAQIDWQDFIKGVVNVLDAGNEEEALAICEDTSVPVANVVATAIRHRKGSQLALREAVDAQGRVEIGRLDRRLASLSLIGQSAPLIGLLGAVIGLVKTVRLVDSAVLVTRADLLGSAMDALVVAALGLAIAIPVMIMHGALRIRMDRLTIELEAAATSIVGYVTANKEGDK